jgi:hypothetical protein
VHDVNGGVIKLAKLSKTGHARSTGMLGETLTRAEKRHRWLPARASSAIRTTPRKKEEMDDGELTPRTLRGQRRHGGDAGLRRGGRQLQFLDEELGSDS